MISRASSLSSLSLSLLICSRRTITPLSLALYVGYMKWDHLYKATWHKVGAEIYHFPYSHHVHSYILTFQGSKVQRNNRASNFVTLKKGEFIHSWISYTLQHLRALIFIQCIHTHKLHSHMDSSLDLGMEAKQLLLHPFHKVQNWDRRGRNRRVSVLEALEGFIPASYMIHLTPQSLDLKSSQSSEWIMLCWTVFLLTHQQTVLYNKITYQFLRN